MATPIVYYRESRFAPNEVLTSRMLENVYTYPRAIVDIQYQTYPDGILTGLDFNQDATGNVFLTPGLVKYKGRIYILA